MELYNGVVIPNVGLGTWLIDNDKVDKVVCDAVSLGYRHIDTAQAYENEEGVGIGIKNCGIPRNELFITTKIRAEYKDYDSAKKSFLESLKKLGLDYLDLVIIHSPQPWVEFRESDNNYFRENLEVWRALEDLYDEGLVKAIGVSNFHDYDLQNIIDNCRIKPMVNQVLSHIGQTPFGILNYCNENNIVVEAYSPIAHGEAGRLEDVAQIARKYRKSVAQICLKYQLQLGCVVLPKASSVEHLKNNLDLNFEISNDDLEFLSDVVPLDNYGEDDDFPVFKHSGE